MRALLAILLLPMVALADAGGNLVQRQNAFRESTQRSFSSCPQLSASYPVGQVLPFRMVNQVITLGAQPPSAAENGTYRLRIDSLPGLNTLSVGRTRKGEPPESLSFTHFNFTDPHAIVITTNITWNLGSLTIARYVQLGSGFYQVSLGQGDIAQDDNAPPGARPQAAVCLVIQASGDGNANALDLTYTAPDLLTLRREHPRELDEHLRPILHDLGLESLFAADPMLAWQVFADELRPEAGLTEEIKGLLPDLDSVSSRKREGAIRKLQSGGLPMAIALVHYPRTKLTPQQDVLLDAALTPFHGQRGEDLGKLRTNISFLVDCLYLDDAQLRRVAMEQLRRVTGKSLDPGAFEDPILRAGAVERLRKELTVATRPGG